MRASETTAVIAIDSDVADPEASIHFDDGDDDDDDDDDADDVL